MMSPQHKADDFFILSPVYLSRIGGFLSSSALVEFHTRLVGYFRKGNVIGKCFETEV